MELGSWEAAGIAAKALTYALSLTAAGGAIFILIFSRLLRDDERGRIANVSRGLALAAVLFTALRLPIIAGALGGELSSMWDASLLSFVFQSSEGYAAQMRAAGLLLILVLGDRSPAASVLAAVGAAMVSASFAFTGHTLALERGLFPQVLLTIHLIGVSYWLGAFHALRYLTYTSDLPRVALIMKRFGDIALYGVGALVAAGFVLLWIMLESPLVLFESAYGRLVAVKLLLVAGLLSLAAANKLLLTPALVRGDFSALPRLRKSITAELAVAGLILAITAVFTTVTGPPALE
jgi:putative copper resistance protein D